MSFGCHSSSHRVDKVRKIFTQFDANRDGRLNRAEMSALVVAVNPLVKFSSDQIAAILDEVFRTYGDYIDGDKGLTFEGLQQTYDDGAGDVDRDFDALSLELDIERGVADDEAQDGNKEVSSINPSMKSGDGLVTDDKVALSRRKRSVGSWAGSPKNGIAYDDTWRLVEDLEITVRRLEVKMDARSKRGRDDAGSTESCTATIGWSRDLTSTDGSSSSEVTLGRRAWEELGQDYTIFQKRLAELRVKADEFRTQDEAFDAQMAVGRTLFDHRLYKEALVSFKRAAQLKPTDVRPHFQHGNTLYALGRISEAREAYTLALDAGEVSGSEWAGLLPQIHVNLGIALEAEGMLLGASEHYKEAAIREPKHYRALKLLGSALYGVGEYRAAKEALLEAIFLNADYADAHCDLGSVLHALRDREHAIKEFQKAIDLKPDHIEALYNLGTLLKDMGQFARSADTYSKVLALRPDHWRAQLNRAVSLLGAGEIDEAKKAFKEAYRMTRRSELYDAILHLRHMEKRPKGLSSFLRKGEENAGTIGESFRAEDNSVTVDASRFNRANARTTPRQWLACALDIRRFQRYTRLNRCDVANVKKELDRIHRTGSFPDVGVSEKFIRKEALEKVLRRLLHFLKPEVFQGAVKAINEKVLTVLDAAESGRVDLGMVFAMLAPVCGGSLDKRKHTAFDALVWRSSKKTGGEISREDANQYMNLLRAAYLHEEESPDFLMQFSGGDQASISYPEFVDIFDDLDWGFGIMSIVTKLELGDQVRHGGQTCSVCAYPIIGPWFKEVKAEFSLCCFCYSAGKVPSTAKQQEYYFKEYNSEVAVVKDRLRFFKLLSWSR